MKTPIKILGLLLLTISLSFSPSHKKTVIIDVSHGGEDHGQLQDDIAEKDLVLQIAERIKTLSEHSDIQVVLTRHTDVFISLKDRVKAINAHNPKVMISLHANGHTDTSISGFELFYNQGVFEKKSEALAANMNTQLDSNLKSRGVQEADFHVLKHTSCPAVLLEMGYLTNAKDREYLTSDVGQTAIAVAIIKSLEEF